MHPIVDPAHRAEIVALGQDLSLAYEIGAMRLALARVLAAVEDDAADPRLLRSAGALGNVIARLVQTQARLAGQADPLAGELDQAHAFLDLDSDAVPGAATPPADRPAPDPTPRRLEATGRQEAEPELRQPGDIAAPVGAPPSPASPAPAAPASYRAATTPDQSPSTSGAPDRDRPVTASPAGRLATGRAADAAATARHAEHAPASPPRSDPSPTPPERPPRSARQARKPGRRARGQRR